MKFSGKMGLMIYDDIKSHKERGFTLCLEGTLFGKPQWGEGGGLEGRG